MLERGVEKDWFASLLVEKDLMRFVFAASTREALEKNNLLSGALLHFYCLVLASRHTPLLRLCAERAKELGLETRVPFSKMVVVVAEEAEEVPKVTVAPEAEKSRLREELEEEAYFDSVDEEEGDRVDVEQPAEPVKMTLLPSFAEKKEEDFSMDSFFGGGAKESSKKSVHIDIKLFDIPGKRTKLDS